MGPKPTLDGGGIWIGTPTSNPVKTATLDLPVSLPPGSKVECSIFTTAFRLVARKRNDAPDPTLLRVELLDNSGQPLANGLYYLRVIVTAPGETKQVLLTIVIAR